MKNLFQYDCLASFIRFRIVMLLIHLSIRLLLICFRIWYFIKCTFECSVIQFWKLQFFNYKTRHFTVILLSDDHERFFFCNFILMYCTYCIACTSYLDFIFYVLFEKYCNDMVLLQCNKILGIVRCCAFEV